MEPITLTSIKTKADLDKVLKFLDSQGFGRIYDHDLIQTKVNNLINKYNTLGVKYDDSLKYDLSRLEDYTEMENKASQYFSKFSPDDRIFELLEKIRITHDDSCQTPYSRPDNKDIIAWVDFKTKYNLKDEFGVGNWVEFYNLDKTFLKIYFGDNSWEFKKLYTLIYGEECPDFNSRTMGTWQSVGKIDLKLFQNNYANIKGDLTSLKNYYYKELTKKVYRHTIIKYNGKVEILKSKDR